MDENRKKIIVKEILYWKESRMLPVQYCDYLLTLYTEGNRPKEFIKNQTKNRFDKKQYLFLMLIPVSVFLIYFTELSFILQMALLAFLMISGLFVIFYFSKKGILMQIPLIVIALMLLLASVEIISGSFPNNPQTLYMVLFLNCFLWLFTGWRLKILYFTISGLLGIALLIVSIFI
ncbi:hypothetical protein ACFYKX_21680 [Cytobacillus sp. FJAT-54145]|uniref:Uncharacterized protein n=1 Tax=Cytobacillus spartinae TaxID=3299023 RepID=A0ABW6KHG4_9BACI